MRVVFDLVDLRKHQVLFFLMLVFARMIYEISLED